MKKVCLKGTALLICLFIIHRDGFAQASSTSHSAGATDWCGWDATSSIPFNLEHRGTDDINFATGGVTSSFQRMTIKGSAYATPGFVGIGLNFTAPQSLLHLNSTAAVYSQTTNGTTGSAAGNGLKIGLASTGNAEFRQQTNLPMQFFIRDGAGGMIEPIRIIGSGTYMGQPLPDGMVSIGLLGATNAYGVGPVLNNYVNPAQRSLSLVVLGGIPGNIDGDANVVAEFRATDNATNSGIRIRGNRGAANTNLCSAFIDFNFYDSGTASIEKKLARVGASYLTSNNQASILRFYTNDGTVAVPVPNMLIDNNGNTGISHNVFREYDGFGTPGVDTHLPQARLHVVDNAKRQLRLARTYPFGSKGGTFSDFETTTTAELLIDPRIEDSAGSVTTVGIVKINEGLGNTIPYSNLSLEVNGQENIRTVNNDNTMTKILVWDNGAGMGGRVKYRDISSIVGTGTLTNANNGTSLDPSNPATVQFGNNVGSAPAVLLNDREVPMSNFNIHFTGQGANSKTNAIGIGTNSSLPLIGRLTVKEAASTPVTNHLSAGVYSQNADVFGSVSSASSIGVYGDATGIQTTPKVVNYGGTFLASGGSDNYGVSGYADAATNSSGNGWGGRFEAGSTVPASIFVQAIGLDAVATGSVTAYGVRGQAINGQSENVGVFGFADNANANTLNVGVLGSVNCNLTGTINIGGSFVVPNSFPSTLSTQNIGIEATVGDPFTYNQTPGVDYAAYFNGDVYINSAITSGTGYVLATSDSTLKTRIAPMTNNLAKIKSLIPRAYYYDTTNAYNIHLPGGKQYGLIAQQVQAVIPELVKTVTKPADIDKKGHVVIPKKTYLSLNYSGIIPFLIGAVNEQSKTIDSLKTTNSKQDSINSVLKQHDSIQNYRLTTLENALNACCNRSTQASTINNSTSPNSISATDVKLTNGQSVVLEQNVPNPFAEQTTINYFLPDDVSKAQMLFYNSEGKLIQSVDLAQRGKGQLNVFASDLTNGIYTYTLVVDGKIIETKKMMKQ